MQTLPLTVRRSIEIIGLAVFFWFIVVAADILSPIVLAFFLTILMYPLFKWLTKKKLPEMVAIIIVLVVLLAGMAAVVWFISTNITRLIEDFSTLKANVTLHLERLSSWISSKTNYSTERQLQLINQQSEKLVNFAGGYVGGIFSSLTALLIFFGLVPIYIFLLLFYRNLLLRFVFLWYKEHEHERVKETVKEMQGIIKSYLGGLLIQIAYITILLGGILMLFGIKHALLIGVLFAFLNLIPYIGALIGNVIGVLLTLSSSDHLSPILTVLIAIAAVQFLDNNILMPKIVGSKVRINALTSIVAVIAGGALAGISGMFLSLPVIAVLKIIFDRSNHLKQWGVLFGDERPPRSPFTWPRYRKASPVVQDEIKEESGIEVKKGGT
ncbi:AI-2E family transporter [Niastella sp. OAS944]|uniref:AI-2E family transporter n=1 Tax=Niastella sp. OAS944 TaxID=2664089 RepID=UPI0035C7D551|nr:putative PurR-regulated permease PerM [Chitinophagaceae bacterium OAS944]